MTSERSKVQNDAIREFFKRWPKLYYFIATVFGPMWFTGLSPSQFLKKYAREGIKVNLGSGPRKIAQDIVNIDGSSYDGVDVVADITQLPLESDSVSMIVCDNVLEHVSEPERAVSEIRRILSEGGIAYIATPFLYPFHSSPNDYHRWTDQGLRFLFREFRIVDVGIRCGTFSSITVWLCYVFARMFSFGSDRMHQFLVNVALFIFFPIKFIDIIFNFLPHGTHTAAVLYCVIEKQSHEK